MKKQRSTTCKRDDTPHEWKFVKIQEGEYSGAKYYLHECRRCMSFVRWLENIKPGPNEGTERWVGDEIQEMTCEEVQIQKIQEE